MVLGLERRQTSGHVHFVTFSCWHRLQYLEAGLARDVFEQSLAQVSLCHGFDVVGYVVMPEHVHLLVTEPGGELLSAGLQALKVSVSRRSQPKPFWQARYHDFNVYRDATRGEKLRYMHANPVKRGLVETPEEWAWSSGRFYRTGVQGRVKIVPFPEDLFVG